MILLGDMNDELDAATTLILNGPPGSEIGSVGFDQPDQGDGDRMWNTAPLIPEAEAILAPLPRPDGADRPHLRQPLPRHRHAHAEVTTVAAPPGMPSIEDDPNERIGEPGSDHAAVVATFDF